MEPFIWLILTLIDLYMWAVIIRVIIELLANFQVLDARSPFVASTLRASAIDRAGAGADPRAAAQSRRRRHIPDHPDRPAELPGDGRLPWSRALL